MKKIRIPASAIKITALGLFAMALINPMSACAGTKQGSIEVSPFAGYTIFEKRQNLQNGLIYGMRNGFVLTNHFALEGTVEFVNTGVKDKAITGDLEGQFRFPKDRIDLTMYHIDGIFNFMPDKKFGPFLLAGVGGARYVPKISNRNMLTFTLGAGAKYWLAEHIALRLDVRDNMVSEAFQESIKSQYNYHTVNVALGVVFAFGGEQKFVMAKDTIVPYVTLAIPYSASIGAPLHRKTRIAFSESVDPATITDETFSLWQGTTQVPGSVSATTGTTACFSQTENLKPNTIYVGKVTGVKDLAGNAMTGDFEWSFKTLDLPDTVTVIGIDKLVMIEDTHFEFDKAALNNEGKKMLDLNIKIFRDNPVLKVRIAGYTSAAGTKEYNQDLSERRADAVLNYLVAQGGVDPTRLETIGYGDTRPAQYEAIPSDINSKEAKANMRVLFEVIVK